VCSNRSIRLRLASLSRHGRSGESRLASTTGTAGRSGASEAPPGPRSLPRISVRIVTGRLARPPIRSPRSSVALGTIGAVRRKAGFFDPLYPPPTNTPVRPETGTPHRHLDSAAPALPDAHRVHTSADAPARGDSGGKDQGRGTGK
jgi:hypothetical protein